MSISSDWINCHYEELRKVAHHLMCSERGFQTLQPTALLNEVLSNIPKNEIRDPKAYVISAMINHLRSRANAKKTLKRDWGQRAAIDDIFVPARASIAEIEAVEEALERLAAMDFRCAEIIKMKYLAGMTLSEIGVALGISERTIKRDLQKGKAWLRTVLNVVP